MANLFDQYGIKEVADVSIYKIEDNGAETPFLFLDSLKVSTVEQSAEQADARGGKGNSKLITWDYGKEINLTLEDALYSPASMALMFGAENPIDAWEEQTTITKMMAADFTSAASAGIKIKDANGKEWTVAKFIKKDGSTGTSIAASDTGHLMVEASASVTGKKLTLNAEDFPGTYKIVGDTYARNRDTGRDEYFQFIIPRAKLASDQTLTLQAEGDPSTFNLSATVLRPKDGKMIELVQYTIA